MAEVFDIQIVGAQAIKEALGAMIHRAQNPELYLNKVGLTVKEQTRLRFIEGVSPEGAKWLPVLRGGQPLRDTGTHLMNAINHSVQGSSVFVGVPYSWAKVHQFGATISAKNAPYLRFKIGKRWVAKRTVRIPARPFFGINENDKKEILAVLANALIDQGKSSTKKA